MEGRRYGVSANAISPLAVTRISEGFFTGDIASDPALDPARSSAVVAWLQSPDSSWLTGQIRRIDGHKLSHISGYSETTGRYHAKNGALLQFSEIGDAVGLLYGTTPHGLTGPLPII